MDFHSIAWIFQHGGGDGFYRPIGYVSLWIDQAWAGQSPMLWHATGLALHVANCALVYWLGRRLYDSPRVGLIAAALFAVSGTRPEAVSWVAARFDLIATFFSLLTIDLFLACRQPGRVLLLIPAAACFTLALLSKESAYAIPLLIPLLLASTGAITRRDFKLAAPLAAIAAIAFTYRWTLVGGIGGYPDAVQHSPTLLRLLSLSTLKALLIRIWAILLFPINWSVEPETWLAAGMAVFVIALCWIVANQGRAPRGRVLYLAVAVIVSVIPAAPVALIGEDLQGARVVYLPSVFFALLMACLIGNAFAGRGPALPALALTAILGFNLMAFVHNIRIWGDASRRARNTCEAAIGQIGKEGATVAGLPRTLNGVFFFANGFPECLEMHGLSPNVPVRVTDRAPATDLGAKILTWDAAASRLR